MKKTLSINSFALLFLFIFFAGQSNSQWIRSVVPDAGALNAVCMLNDQTGFVGGLSLTDGTFLSRTTDGGISWNYIINSSGTGTEGISFIKFKNSSTGWFGGNNFLAYTNDGGSNWTYDTLGFTAGNIGAVFFPEDVLGIGWFSSANGTSGSIGYSADWGASWSEQSTTPDGANDLFFLDAYTGFIIGNNGLIMRTTNSGTNWSSENLDLYSNNCIDFVSPNTGFISCSDGRLRKTTDGGNSWTTSVVNSGGNYCVSFPSGTVGYCGNDNYSILKTIDAGNSWSTLQMPAGSNVKINHINFINNLTGFAVGSNLTGSNAFFKTVNGGESAPIEPVSLTALALSGSQIRLSWVDQSNNEEGFRIEQSPNGTSGWVTIDSVTANTILYTNSGLCGGTQYYYRVFAYNSVGNSSYSNPANAVTDEVLPLQSLPANASQILILTPTLVWEGIQCATSYKLQVATDVNFNSLVINDSGISTLQYSVQSGTLQFNTTYYWRVAAVQSGVAGNWNTAWSFETYLAPPPAPVLVSPAFKSSCQPLAPVMQWNASSGANSYNIQVASDTGFANKLIDTTGLTGTQISVPAGLLQHYTTYYWRVAAVNAGGAGSWCGLWMFTTTLDASTLVAPADNAVNQVTTLTLSWQGVTGDSTNTLQVATDAAFTSPVINLSGITADQYSVPASTLQNNTLYYWRVRSDNESCSGPWSQTRNFATIISAPQAPVLNYPANNALCLPLIFNLQWDSSTTASTYNVQIASDTEFVSKIIDVTGITATQVSIVPGQLQLNTKYYWRVSAVNPGGTSSWSALWNFTTILDSPALVLPANSAINQPIDLTFDWADVNGALNYTLQAATDSLFAAIVINQAALDSSQYIVPASTLSGNTTYYWRVKANVTGCSGAWSLTRNFSTIMSAPNAPVLSNPVNNALCQPLAFDLQWDSTALASTYSIQVATDSGFANKIIDTAGLTARQLSVTAGMLQYNTVYYWRANALNFGGTSPWSAIWNFTTVLDVPVLVLPVNNAVNQPLTLTFDWADVNGATSYSLQAASDSLFTTIAINQAALDSSHYTVPQSILFNNTTYFWRVKANMAGCSGAYSSVWKFSTILGVPPRPVCTLPLNNSVNQPLTPILIWNAANGADSYNIQLSTDSLFQTNLIDTTGITATQLPIEAGKLNFDTKYFWRVAGVNIGGAGLWSFTWNFRTVLPIITFNLTMIPGGFYNTGTGMLNMKDTVMAYLVDTTGGCHKVDSASGVIDSVTFQVQLIFQNANSGNYYLFVYHRNHIPVSSAGLLSFTRGAASNYSFTDDATKAFGSNMIQVSTTPVLWALIPGDANKDEFVDGLDQTIWTLQNGLDGYNSADFNGDLFVDGLDQTIWVYYNGNSSYLPCMFSTQSTIGKSKVDNIRVFRPVKTVDGKNVNNNSKK